jgi:hypothetical protein
MRLVKIFKGFEHEYQELETQINTWIQETNANVLQIFGNIAPQSSAKEVNAKSLGSSQFASSDIMIFVLYTKN